MMMMLTPGRGSRGLVTSHSDSKLHAGTAAAEDVEIQVLSHYSDSFRRQQTTSRPPHLSTFRCLHPPPLQLSISAAAATTTGGKLFN